MKRLNLRSLAGLRGDESGAAAVEFAIVSSAFITFMLVIAYAGIMLHTNASLQWAVETTIRRAAINPSVTETQLETTLNGYLDTTHLPHATSVSYTITAGTPPVANLTASFQRQFTIPFVATFNTTYTATARMSQNAS